jgi:hypothetical protein
MFFSSQRILNGLSPWAIGVSPIINRKTPDFVYIKWAIFIYFIAKDSYEKEEHNVGGRR